MGGLEEDAKDVRGPRRGPVGGDRLRGDREGEREGRLRGGGERERRGDDGARSRGGGLPLETARSHSGFCHG